MAIRDETPLNLYQGHNPLAPLMTHYQQLLSCPVYTEDRDLITEEIRVVL